MENTSVVKKRKTSVLPKEYHTFTLQPQQKKVQIIERQDGEWQRVAWHDMTESLGPMSPQEYAYYQNL